MLKAITLVAEASSMAEKHVSIPKPFFTGNITEQLQKFVRKMSTAMKLRP